MVNQANNRRSLKRADASTTPKNNTPADEQRYDPTKYYPLQVKRLQKRLKNNTLDWFVGKNEVETKKILFDLESDFYKKISFISATLASYFDFSALVRKSTDVKSISEAQLKQFAQSFDFVINLLLKILKSMTADTNISISKEEKALQDNLRMTLLCRLKQNNEQKLSFWQTNIFDPLLITSLRFIFNREIDGSVRSHLEILTLYRPHILRDMFGVDPKIRHVEKIASMVDETLSIPAVLGLEVYDNTVEEFEEKKMINDEQIWERLKEEALSLLGIPQNKLDEDGKNLQNLFLSVVQNIKRDEGESLKSRARSMIKDENTIISVLARNVNPIAADFGVESVEKVQNILVRDWRTVILPKILSYLSKDSAFQETDITSLKQILDLASRAI